ncbi:DEAD/DEAH box helicase family protein [bacterium]|nr:DEAD/DEAH box helicase family protein [bacterium]
MPKEAKARIKINKLLEDTGWRFFDSNQGRANIALEVNAKLSERALNELGEDFEKTKNGFIDFLLLDKNGFPFVVLEAKKEDKSPLDGKEQARQYAQSINVRFVILSNGNIHYFWDVETDNPHIITTFPSQDSISHKQAFTPDRDALIREEVGHDYIAITQNQNYSKDPQWQDESQREKFIENSGLRFLREYQKQAVRSIQDAVKQGKDRFLFEMATGTGKTLVSAAVSKLFLRTSNAKRVLFLVDRLELEDQARRNFKDYLKNDFKCVIYKENKDDWIRAEIVVSTVQSLLFNNKYKDLFSPTDFDLVISDEAHRSIGGNSRAVFEYFIGYKLGLTATPKNYLKNVDISHLANRDPRALEQRQLLDTYTTFGCLDSDPTFRYSLLAGVREGYLINPITIDARTEITTQLLSDEGYAVVMANEEGGEEEKIFYQKDFEKKLFSDETNLTFCKTFFDNALRDPLTKEIGKTICFCVSQNHASKVTQILNELAHQKYPGKYNSDFAVQITSNVSGAQQMTINFANNRLNGNSKFVDGYSTSKTRVCVTVGMMTTGYDCRDILNLCMLRPIFSPTDFIQIKGRGTRKYAFVHKEADGMGGTEAYKQEKEKFKLFDFFANCEYFDDKYPYDEVLELPKNNAKVTGPDPVILPKESIEYENVNPDPITGLHEKVIGLEGMRIDRKLFEKFEETISADEHIKAKINEGKFEEAEAYIKQEVFNKPEEYFDLEKLRKSIKLDRRVSLREILEKIFGTIKKFKTKDELLEEEVQKFISIYHPQPEFAHIIGQFMKAYISDNEIRQIMETGEFSSLATNPRFNMRDLQELGELMVPVMEYVKDYVPLNAFM